VEHATANNSCESATGEGCVKPYCKCNDNYKVSGGNCVADSDQKYTVEFSCGEGDTGTPPDAKPDNDPESTITLPETSECTKDGVAANGWSCSGTSYDLGGAYTVNSDVTCTAQYPEGDDDLETRARRTVAALNQSPSTLGASLAGASDSYALIGTSDTLCALYEDPDGTEGGGYIGMTSCDLKLSELEQ
jgi:hypothetical protein